jgi:His-Xaa-Ser system protein HxsD
MQVCEVQRSESIDLSIMNIVVDLNLYSLIAVKKSCYKFTADCSIQMNCIGQDKVGLIFTFPAGVSIEAKDRLIADFYNELIDQDLRDIISKETEQVRNLILAEAFSKTSLLEIE